MFIYPREVPFHVQKSLTRRQFIRETAAAGAMLSLGARPLRAQNRLANDKLKIGVIGTANRAKGNIEAILGENIVALCDVDDTYLAKAQEQFPEARTYNDFREMLQHPGLE